MQKFALESFDNSDRQAKRPSEEYTLGYTDGYAAGTIAAETEQAALRSELIQSISDLEFRYHEARSEITRSLAPLFSGLVAKVFPACVTDWFSDQIIALLQQASDQNETGEFKLCVSPMQLDAITAALAESTIKADIIADPRLSQNAAWIGYDQNELKVDCDQLLSDIRSVLSAIDNIEVRSDTNG